MARTKKMWRTVLASLPVTWACYNPHTYEPNASTRNGPWARLLRLNTRTLDGRELQTLLTPRQARKLARRLDRQADAIDKANRENGNGWAPDADEEDDA